MADMREYMRDKHELHTQPNKQVSGNSVCVLRALKGAAQKSS